MPAVTTDFDQHWLFSCVTTLLCDTCLQFLEIVAVHQAVVANLELFLFMWVK